MNFHATRLSQLIVLLLIGMSAAMARDYQVELIVFEQRPSELGQHERSSIDSSITNTRRQRMQVLQQQARNFPFAERLRQLAAVRATLLQTGHAVLKTASWTQPAALYPAAPLVALGGAADALHAGFVRIYKTNLIFADLDLQFIYPGDGQPTPSTSAQQVAGAAPDGAAASASQHYFIAEKRRLKFGELHYFDHPGFGAILGVWPVEADRIE